MRLTAALVTLALALGTGAFVGRSAAPRVGDAIARRLAQVAAIVVVAPPELQDVETVAPVPASDDPTPPRPAPRPRWNVRAGSASPARSSDGAVEIPAERLACLTEKQLRSLSARDAVDTNGNAAGATLSGVGALGVGLDDGDVVTSIDGRATRDVSTALAAAMQAYGSGRDTARATVRRGGRTLAVLVHIPRSARPKG